MRCVVGTGQCNQFRAICALKRTGNKFTRVGDRKGPKYLDLMRLFLLLVVVDVANVEQEVDFYEENLFIHYYN